MYNLLFTIYNLCESEEICVQKISFKTTEDLTLNPSII